jgi:hypothetical protein
MLWTLRKNSAQLEDLIGEVEIVQIMLWRSVDSHKVPTNERVKKRLHRKKRRRHLQRGIGVLPKKTLKPVMAKSHFSRYWLRRGRRRRRRRRQFAAIPSAETMANGHGMAKARVHWPQKSLSHLFCPAFCTSTPTLAPRVDVGGPLGIGS